MLDSASPTVPAPSSPASLLPAGLRTGRRFVHRKLRDARRAGPAVFEVTGVTFGAVHFRLVSLDEQTGAEVLGWSHYTKDSVFAAIFGGFVDTPESRQ